MTMHVPQTQTAIVADGSGGLVVSNTAPVPALQPDSILIRTAAVALNPVDYKTRAPPFATPGCLCGTDLAGTVVSVGSAADPRTALHGGDAHSTGGSRPLRPGDRVLAVVHGMHSITPEIGAFAQYVCAVGHLVLRVPDHLSWEEGAAMGTAIATVGQALFRSLRVPGYPGRPDEKKTKILIYGGSSATGTMAIQFAKLCGMTVLTTCSPSNFDLVRSYGADHVYDYRSPSATADIKRMTGNALKFVLDCISSGPTMEFCYQCIGRTGGRYTRLEPYPEGLAQSRPVVQAAWILAPLLNGKPIAWPAPFGRDADPEAREWALGYYATVQQLLDAKQLRPHPVRTSDGFENIVGGLDTLGTGKVSGEKLVVRIP